MVNRLVFSYNLNTFTYRFTLTTNTMNTHHTNLLRQSIGMTIDFEVNTKGQFDHISFSTENEFLMEDEEFDDWGQEVREEYESLLKYLVREGVIKVELDLEHEGMKMVTIGTIEVLK